MQTAVITAGTNSSTVNIAVVNDDIVEGDETFTMNLNVPFSPGIVAGAITMATVTIIDTSTIGVSFTQRQFTASEAMGFVQVNLELTRGSSASPFNVTVTPSEQSPVSAEGGDDFNTAPLIATFDSGMTMSSVTVPVTSDDISEGTEEFDLTLTVPPSLAPAITAGGRNTAVGEITDSTRVICSCSEESSSDDNKEIIITLSTSLGIAIIALIISVLINVVQRKQQSRHDVNQSRLRSKINQSVNNNIYNVEQSRYSEIKQSASAGSNTITDTTIKKPSPVKQSEAEYETIIIDPKPTECVNNESWL